MSTLFGLPLFGSLFTPILIAVLSVILYKTIFSATKTDIKTDHVNIQPVQVTKPVKDDTVKQKKKKSCSGKKGGKGCCSTKNGLIDVTKLFVESSSSTQALCDIFLDLWKENNLEAEVIPVGQIDVESRLLQETGSVSLCVFLLNKNEDHPLFKPWLDNLINTSPRKSDKLSGLKYSVFVANAEEGDTIHNETDSALHKLGGVRVCKAGILDFTTWLEGLSQTVSKWNQGSKKGCKCGPDNANEIEGEHSSCSGSCSSSEEESTLPPILDLEDLGKALS